MKKYRRFLPFAFLLLAQAALLVLLAVRWQAQRKVTLTPADGLSALTEDAVCDENGLRPGAASAQATFGATRWLTLEPGCYRATAYVQPSPDASGYMETTSQLATSNKLAAVTGTSDRVNLDFWLPQSTVDLQLRFYCETGAYTVTALELTPVNDRAVLLSLAALFFCLDGALLLLGGKLPRLSRRRAVLLVVWAAVTVFVSAPVLGNFLPKGDDINFHLMRIESLAADLADGQFPVRIQSLWFGGQGYPVSSMYCDLFLYAPALLRLAGYSLQGSYQFYVAAVNAATLAAAWYAFRKMLNSDASAGVAALLYTLAPYRLVDLYRRAAVGEYTAMVFLPLILLGLWNIYNPDPADERRRTGWIPAAVGFAGLLQCHLISTLMAGLFTLAACLILLRRTLRPPVLWALCKTAGAAVLASAWFLIPMLDTQRLGGMQITETGGRQNIQNAGAFLGQLVEIFVPGGGKGLSVYEGMAGKMPQNPGSAMLLALLLFLVLWLLAEQKTPPLRMGRMAAVGGGAALALCLWTTPWNLLEDKLPAIQRLFTVVQFPWRYLAPACVFLALLAGCVCEALQTEPLRRFARCRQGLAAVFVLLSVLECGYTISTFTDTAAVLHPATVDGIDSYNAANGEYLPSVLDAKAVYGLPKDIRTEGDLTAAATAQKGLRITLRVEAGGGGTVILPLVRSPFYTAVTDAGEKLATGTAANGQLTVTVPAGFSGTVTVAFRERLLWKAGNAVSLLFAAAALGGLLLRRRRLGAGAAGASGVQ